MEKKKTKIDMLELLDEFFGCLATSARGLA
jgi:hypothetical protein